jgi:hypothetical protein
MLLAPPATTEFFWDGPARADYRTDHPQVALYHAPMVYRDGAADVVYVDLLLADPLLRMWNAGICTTWSCQGDPGNDTLKEGYCVIADASRTYEAVRIIGVALDVSRFSFDSLLMPDHEGYVPGGEVIRWNRRARTNTT